MGRAKALGRVNSQCVNVPVRERTSSHAPGPRASGRGAAGDCLDGGAGDDLQVRVLPVDVEDVLGVPEAVSLCVQGGGRDRRDIKAQEALAGAVVGFMQSDMTLWRTDEA